MPAGRPRSEAARDAILTATREELAAHGYDKLTIERVAIAAGVAKQTVYRWYPSKNALIADCLLHGYVLAPEVGVRERGTAREDILDWVHEFVRVTRDPQVVALIRAASAASAEDLEVSRGFQNQMNMLARDSLADRIRRGSEAGELRPAAPAQTIAEIVVGALLYRLSTHEEITADFVDDLTGVVFDGVSVAWSI